MFAKAAEKPIRKTLLRRNLIEPLEHLDQYFSRTECIDNISIEKIILESEDIRIVYHDCTSFFTLSVRKENGEWKIYSEDGKEIFSELDNTPYQEIKEKRKQKEGSCHE